MLVGSSYNWSTIKYNGITFHCKGNSSSKDNEEDMIINNSQEFSTSHLRLCIFSENKIPT